MRSLIDLWEGEVLRVKVGRATYTLKHIPAYQQMTYLKNIASAFYLLNLLAKKEERAIAIPWDNKKQQEKKQEVAEMIRQTTSNSEEEFLVAYENCLYHMWNLLKKTIPFYKRFSIKKAFYKKGRKNINWFLALVKEVYDFWLFLGKQIGLLAQMKTLTMITGQGYQTYSKRKAIVTLI